MFYYNKLVHTSIISDQTLFAIRTAFWIPGTERAIQ